MSIDQTRAFIKRMKEDVEFADQILAIDDLDLRIEFINKAGYETTREEIEQVGFEVFQEIEANRGVMICCGYSNANLLKTGADCLKF